MPNVTKHVVGTVIVFIHPDRDITVGKKYTINDIDSDGEESFIDDVGDKNWLASTGNHGQMCIGDGVYVVVS